MNYAVEAHSGGYSVGGQLAAADISRAMADTTIAENIDNRITMLTQQIARLEIVKRKLAEGSILNVSLSDLQLAMQRY